MRVALATCRKLPEVDVDERPLVERLERGGARVRLLAWDGPDAAEPGELVVVRSTWNYHEDVESFLAWVDRTSRTTQILNPARLIAENARKTYLRDLDTRGIAVVPTEYVARGAAFMLEQTMARRGWQGIVVKPVVSCGSFATRRFDDAGPAQEFVDRLSAERDVMVQRWMPAVETYGERALVWIAGDVTHAVRKSPRFDGDDESVSAAIAIAADERAFAERVLAPIAKDLLYARVDTIREDDGTIRLMELELIEPSLFLTQSPEALERLADAILARARLIRSHAPP